MAAYFKDLNKRLSDLITKEFPGEKQENKVVWTGTTANNVSFETNFVQRKDGSILGTLIPKYVYKPWGTTFSAEINTKKDVKLEVAVAEKLAPGLKTTVTANSKTDGNFGSLAVDYKHEHGTFSIAADYGKQNGSVVNAAAVVAHQNWSVGAKADYLLGITQDSDLLEFQANLGYNSDEFDVQAFGRVKSLGAEEDKHELGATYFHRINNDLSVGTEVVFDVSNTGANKPKLTFASQYRLENDTVLKGKFDTDGRLGLSYQQKFSRNAKLTIGAAIDANNLNKNSSTFGFTLNLSD